MPLLVAGIGCLVGIVSTTARGHGRGRRALPRSRCAGCAGRWWSAPSPGLLLLAAGPLLRLIGQAPELVAGGGASRACLRPARSSRSSSSPRASTSKAPAGRSPGLVAMVGANLVNLALNWLLIGGTPRPAGARRRGRGARLDARARRRWRPASSSGCCGCPSSPPWRARPLRLWGPGGWAAGAEMRRIGLAGGAAYFFETFAFASLAQAAGLLGADPARRLHHPAQHRGAGVHDRARPVGRDRGARRPGGRRRATPPRRASPASPAWPPPWG